MDAKLAEALNRHADALLALADAVRSLSGQQPAPAKPAEKQVEASPPVREFADYPDPGPIDPVIIPGRKPFPAREWKQRAPAEARAACEAAIRALFAAGRTQDISRSLDSVDADRLSEVPDFALPHLYRALEVACEESKIELAA